MSDNPQDPLCEIHLLETDSDVCNEKDYYSVYSPDAQAQIKLRHMRNWAKLQNQKIDYLYTLTSSKHQKAYVGITKDPFNRLKHHIEQSGGSEWTKKYDLKLHSVEPFVDKDDENKHVIRMMYAYGIENVRGGTFSNIHLRKDQVALINQQINALEDGCTLCFGVDHMAHNCPRKPKNGWIKKSEQNANAAGGYNRKRKAAPIVVDKHDENDEAYWKQKADEIYNPHFDHYYCDCCGHKGHGANYCPKRECNTCHFRGHTSDFCPLRGKLQKTCIE